MNFLHSGGMGDIIYSLPKVKAMGGGNLYVKPRNRYNKTCNQYDAMALLLDAQSYIEKVKEYPELPFFQYDPSITIDYDLDSFRLHPDIDHQHLMDSYGVRAKAPWLELLSDYEEFSLPEKYTVVSITPRYRTGFNWAKRLEREEGELLFVGLWDEARDWQKYCDFWTTNDIEDAAHIVKNASRVLCNQSVVLTLAQALGVPYEVEAMNPTRVCLYTENEKRLC